MSSLGIDVNVNVMCIDKGQVVQQVQKHNKATKNLIQGILRFIKGDFSETELNKSPIPEQAEQYLPVRVMLGFDGIAYTTEISDDPETISYGPLIKQLGKEVLDLSQGVSKTSFSQNALVCPAYNSRVIDENEDDAFKIKLMRVSNNNSADTVRLTITAEIPKGALVGYYNDDGDLMCYNWTYYSKYFDDFIASFTEIGLISSTGLLLARVPLDGPYKIVDSQGVDVGASGTLLDNSGKLHTGPVYQTMTSVILIEWSIDITSLGDDDIIEIDQNSDLL